MNRKIVDGEMDNPCPSRMRDDDCEALEFESEEQKTVRCVWNGEDECVLESACCAFYDSEKEDASEDERCSLAGGSVPGPA